MKRFVCGLAAALALSGIAVANEPNDPNAGFPPCGLIGFDDFDSSGVYLTRVITPDLSGSTIVGSFPGSRNDVFGIVDRTVNFDFADDSISIFTADTFGIMPEGGAGGTELANRIFGVEDLTNVDNPSGTGNATWTFDISGATDLKMQLRVAAMGDFEAGDVYTMAYQIDAGSPVTVFTATAAENQTLTYTMENGTNTNVLPDPMSLNGDPNAGGTIVTNCFSNLEVAIAGTGSVLTVTFDAVGDGGSEVFGFDDLRICGSAPNLPPMADAGADVSVVDNDTNTTEDVMLDGTGSTDSDGTITDYDWYINAALVATGPTPTLTFGLGTTTVTLTVTDDGGLTSSDTVDVTVTPGGDPPSADAGAEQEVTSSSKTAPVSVSLDGSGSSDSDGTIVNYSWRENGVEIATGVSPSVNLVPGIHTILLEVLDNAGNTARDAVFVKVLPSGVFARHDFDANLDASVVISPAPGTFTSPADGFGVYQRGVSASIPFGLLDDSGSANPAEPNLPGECAPFPGDLAGMYLCAKQDAFFGAIDLFNADNPFCDEGTATFTFNIAGRTDINVSIDMAASGNFEANPDPNDPNGPACDPNAAGVLDRYDWTYSIDGGTPAALFTSSVDEDGSVDQEFFGGAVITIDDPMVMNGTVLDNNARTITAAVAGTGTTLTVTLNARGDSGSEAYGFDDIVLCEDTGPTCGAGCEVPGGCADTNGDGAVDLTDLANVLANFGAGASIGDTNNDGSTDLTDLANILALFGTACP